jgi:hypothetical protein
MPLLLAPAASSGVAEAIVHPSDNQHITHDERVVLHEARRLQCNPAGQTTVTPASLL